MNIDLSIKNGLLVNICYLSIAEVFKVGVVKVDESVLELSDNHGTILKQFLFQYCTCKMDKKLIFV